MMAMPDGGGPQYPDAALYERMRWNTPLSAEHADLLLDRMNLQPSQAIADLGCGWGELLMTAVARAGQNATGTGIDLDEPREALPKARDEAARRHLNVQFIKADVSSWRGPQTGRFAWAPHTRSAGPPPPCGH